MSVMSIMLQVRKSNGGLLKEEKDAQNSCDPHS